MEESVVPVITEVGKCLAAPIGRQFSYLSSYKTNLDSLKQEAKKLTEERECVHHRVDDAERNGEEIEQKVRTWLTSVDEIIVEAGKIIEDEEKAKSLCFKGLCPNLKSRYKVSRNAEGKVKAITELREEGKFDQVSYRTAPREIWLPANKGYESFESRMETLRNIQNALSDPNVNMIGVYGMGGIGKTTLVKEIAMKAENEKLFDKVVYAHVSQNPKIRKIQGEIADKLGMKFREETEAGRARNLCERLSKEKKIFVILDDVWTHLDLETIGIPVGDDHKGCKVLLTARRKDVSLSTINCEHSFVVSTLNEKEALSLFKKMVGDCIENHDLQPLAIDVVKECGGLPIAIVTIARALRKKTIFQWKNALKELKRPSVRNFTGDHAAVYSNLELSYDHLENKELKSIFLLCSLMDDDASKLDLLKYSMGLGLLQGVETMDEAQDRLYTLVHKLKDSCLLLDGKSSERFSMHDVIRDVALSIASRDEHVFSVRDKFSSIRWPSRDALERCTKINLFDYNISELPEGLECPQLKFFHLYSRHFLLKIPEKFFAGMTDLKVLDFTRMQLMSIPSSIHLLVNLRTLCLDQCVLGDISIIGKLKRLEILSFNNSDIEQLPEAIGQLTFLRLLDISNCYKLKVIQPNVLSSLSQIEELYMGNTYIQWEIEELNIERRNASLHELKNLSCLTNLEIHIKDANILPKGLFSRNLERYKIFIGDEWKWSRTYEGARTLKVKHNTNTCMEDDFLMQLKRIEVLHLDEGQGIKNVLYEVDKESFPQLKCLRIQNNSYFLCIVDLMEGLLQEAFPQLESLFLSNLVSLEKICHGQLTEKSFCKLNTIKVEKCDKLKNIFSFSIVKSLPQLHTIEVTECKAMDKIFAIESVDTFNNDEVIDKIVFRRIHSLTLKSLPQLNSFCSKVKMPSMSEKSAAAHNKVILEDRLDATTSLFNEKVEFPNLEILEVSTINFDKIWQNQCPAKTSSFKNLRRLIVVDCGNLENLFSSSSIEGIPQLQHLDICKCSVLKEIIVVEVLREEQRRSIIFHKLNFMKMEDLQNLTRFSSENYFEFPSLKQLQIKQCPKFKAFVLKDMSTDLTGKDVQKKSSIEIQPFFSKELVFPDLEEMVISHLDELKMIWHNNKLDHKSFDKLKSIKVEGCGNLLTIFPFNMLGVFSMLEFLTIKDCSLLEEIIGLGGLNFIETNAVPKIQLKEVIVSNCKSLKNIFPASIAKSLLQLEVLEIRHCVVLEEIVAKDRGAHASTVTLVFPKIASLVLSNLPKLTNFYSGIHTSKWPMLKVLAVFDCVKLKIFASEFLDIQKASGKGQLDIPYQQPLMFVEKINPNLEELGLRSQEIMMISQSQFPEHYFRKLRRLSIKDDESDVFPLGVLERFYNLEMLSLFYGLYKELFSYEEVEKHAGNLARIKRLWLKHLSHLKHMWQPESKLNSILQNLETLEVEYCDNLINLLPSSSSLQNLTTLEVCYCPKLMNLVTSSTAKSLERLKNMSIDGCKKMEEIVTSDGDEVRDEIVFSKLGYLSLVGLESLTCFCSSSSQAFKFPSLEEIIVTDCPKMKIFCEEALSASKFERVWQKQEQFKWFWEGDINTTIQHLHKKLVNFNSMNPRITIEKIFGLEELNFEETHSTSLKLVSVLGCQSLKNIFQTSIAKSLLQLEQLEVKNCRVLTEIVAKEQGAKISTVRFVFPKVSRLVLAYLPKLTTFYPGVHTSEWQVLEKLVVADCENVKTFALDMLDYRKTNDEGQPDIPTQQPCSLVEKVIARLKFLELNIKDIMMICHGQFPRHHFSKLDTLIVREDEAVVFFQGLLQRFSNLKTLTLCYGSYKELFSHEEVEKHAQNFDISMASKSFSTEADVETRFKNEFNPSKS